METIDTHGPAITDRVEELHEELALEWTVELATIERQRREGDRVQATLAACLVFIPWTLGAHHRWDHLLFDALFAANLTALVASIGLCMRCIRRHQAERGYRHRRLWRALKRLQDATGEGMVHAAA